MKREILYFLIFQFLLNTFYCMQQRAHFEMPERIAVLPTINQTIDVSGGLVFRNLFYLALEEDYSAYLLPLEIIDTLLNEEGITDGGQLSAVENSELFKMLNADGLLFIELLACDYQTLGISETRLVKAHFKLITPPSELKWEFEHEVDHGKSAFDTFLSAVVDPSKTLKDSAEDLGKQLAQKGGRMWLLDHALKPEMEIVIEEAIDSLPEI